MQLIPKIIYLISKVNLNMDISIIIPAFNEEESITELIDSIKKNISKSFTYEVIVIDDGSTDKTWGVLEKEIKKNNFLKGIQFNRNYGKSAALDIGFKKSIGRVVITMDADLQDDSTEIEPLYKMLIDGNYDLVSGWKKKRFDPITKTIPSKFFNLATRVFSGIKLNDFNCGLKAYKNIVVKSISIYGEMHRYIPLIAKWSGFNKIGEKVVKHNPRKYGKTKFGLERFINGFLDLISVSFVYKFKKRPMHFFGSLGVLSFLLGFISTFWIIYDKISKISQGISIDEIRPVTDQPLFFIALIFIIIGVQLFLAGFLAEIMIKVNSKDNDQVITDTKGFS